jgi:hypothetical protein
MFTIDPPLHVRGREPATISSLEQAAAFLRTHFTGLDDEELLSQLESVRTIDEARIAEAAFRAWSQDQGILLVPTYPESEEKQSGDVKAAEQDHQHATAISKRMSDFFFDPALRIDDDRGSIIRTLEDAADFLRNVQRENYNTETQGILNRVEAASTPQSVQDAADAFIGWLEERNLLRKQPT